MASAEMGLSFEEAVNLFIEYVQDFDPTAPNRRWYVGITVNPKMRKIRHEQTKHITCVHFKALIYYKDREDARELEKLLAEIGFAKTKADLMSMSESKESDTIGKKHYVYVYLAIKKR